MSEVLVLVLLLEMPEMLGVVLLGVLLGDQRRLMVRGYEGKQQRKKGERPEDPEKKQKQQKSARETLSHPPGIAEDIISMLLSHHTYPIEREKRQRKKKKKK